jgi:hypothetical protein
LSFSNFSYDKTKELINQIKKRQEKIKGFTLTLAAVCESSEEPILLLPLLLPRSL